MLLAVFHCFFFLNTANFNPGHIMIIIIIYHSLHIIAWVFVSLLTGVVTGICILIFGTMSVVNRQWIQNPDKNYLSFSFGLMVMSGFMVLFGGFCAAFSAAQVRYDQKKSEEKPRYAGHMIKPAPPIYWWECVPLLTLYWSLLDGEIFSCYWTVYHCIF